MKSRNGVSIECGCGRLPAKVKGKWLTKDGAFCCERCAGLPSSAAEVPECSGIPDSEAPVNIFTKNLRNQAVRGLNEFLERRGLAPVGPWNG